MLKVEQTGGKEKQLSPTGQKEAAPAPQGTLGWVFHLRTPLMSRCTEIKAGLSSSKGRTLTFLA